jgi:MFS family permease
LLAGTFVLGLGMTMSSTFASVYLNQLSGQFLVGLFTGLSAVCELPMMHWSERVMRRLGGPATLILSYGLMGGSYLGLALITEPTVVLGAAILRGLGFGLFVPATVRLVASWAPPERSATYQALVNAALWGLAPLLAGPLGGVIYDAAGPPVVFMGATGAAVLAAMILILAQAGGVFKKTPIPADALLARPPD